jgi:hypothetical protein
MKLSTFIERFVTRKFVAATMTAALMFIAWVLCQWLSFARENFGTLVTGLCGALSAYTAGNVMQDHVFTRSAAFVTQKQVSEQTTEFKIPPQPRQPE